MNPHIENSSYRERLLEHLFIGELLKLSWTSSNCSLEISKPEVDRSGYDLIAEANGFIRHIQLKTTFVGSSTKSQKVHVSLCGKPSGCVVLIHFDKESLDLGPYLYFGGDPGEPLPSLAKHRIAKHTKGNALGIKAERPNIRTIPNSAFFRIDTIQQLYLQLFGNQQLIQDDFGSQSD